MRQRVVLALMLMVAPACDQRRALPTSSPSPVPFVRVSGGVYQHSFDDGKRPLPRVKIRLDAVLGASPTPIHEAVADDQGHFEFALVPVGQVMIRVVDPPYEEPCGVTISEIHAPEATIDLHVVALDVARTERIPESLPLTRGVAGVVHETMESTRPIANAEVWLDPTAGFDGPKAWLRTDTDQA